MGFASENRRTDVPHIAPFSDGNAVIFIRIAMYPGSFHNNLTEADSLNLAITADLCSLRSAVALFEAPGHFFPLLVKPSS